MASIPLPALDIKPPQTPDVMAQFGNIERLKMMQQAMQQQQAEAPIQQQILQQQQQSGANVLQQQRQDFAARQALNNAYTGAITRDANGNPTIDSEKLMKGLQGTPAAYQTPAVLKGITDFQKSRLDLQTSATDLQTKTADMLGSAASAIKAANYDPTLAHSLLDTLPQSPQLNAIRAQINNPQALRQMVDSAIANSPTQQKLQNAQTVATIRTQTPAMQEMNDWLKKNPGKTQSDYQQHVVDLGVQADVAKQTNPAIIAAKEQVNAAEARTRQALSQGDPKDAAQLLVDGDATLSELKARGSTPEFIAKTLAAAHQISGGTYNAQQADAAFQVAKSPANVAFFGSSKSLTDKGGTLDQLQAAGKDLPGGLFPALNSIGDWLRAASGSGPIAKYAATALGVADDYAKVMGGGQGSDTSRLQALNLIGAKQSPAQRAAAIDGVRNAVESQTNSRIGNNPVLRRMYGSAPNAQTPKTSPLTITLPSGKKVTID